MQLEEKNNEQTHHTLAHFCSRDIFRFNNSQDCEQSMISEHTLCNAIVEFLNYQGNFVWRTNAGQLPLTYQNKHGQIKKRMVIVGKKGTSDIIGLSKKGRFVAIEVKVPTRRKEVTDAQNMFLEDVRLHGGIAGVACSPEEALSIIKKEE